MESVIAIIIMLGFPVALVLLIVLFLKLLKFRKKSSQLETELINQRTALEAKAKEWAEYANKIQTENQRLKDAYEAEAKQWTDKANALQVENQRLSKWQSVADADAKAAELIAKAQATLDQANADSSNLVITFQQQANSLLENAKNEASAIVSEARQGAKSKKEEAQTFLDGATTKSAEIIEAANKRAEEIAGSAYEAMKNASLYEQTVKAMKNLIEGYGDQYIIPEQSLLDNLAEEFGHTQAGQELKQARERTAAMIRNGTAATCDYVEANRRDTAIRFVIDAFNGKVDSILSRVKHDNSGTLAQEIRDAFSLVNFNGMAFRDARIKEEYLRARLDELKWAAVAQQLKLDEREEQRRIKEQIREEEKVRREIERAMKDTAKEEDLLHKAMEKAQQQIDKASAEQKEVYEAKLRELTQKLQETEERKQRALSMAQQTRRGFVYIISNVGSFGENVYKIGLTRRLEPLDRVRELGDSSVPFEFDVHAMISSDDAPSLENKLHKQFVLTQLNKVNHRKEFFRLNLPEIREQVDKQGLAAKWTMMAEAREYRESMAIEKAIKEDPAAKEAWIKRQLELEPITKGIQEATTEIEEE